IAPYPTKHRFMPPPLPSEAPQIQRCRAGPSRARPEDRQGHLPKDQLPIFFARRREPVKGEPQGIAVAFSRAHRRIVAAPHHAARPEPLVGHLEEWGNGCVEYQRFHHGQPSPAELSEAVHLDVHVRESVVVRWWSHGPGWSVRNHATEAKRPGNRRVT